MKKTLLITSFIALALAIGSAQAQDRPAPPPGDIGQEIGFNPEGPKPPHKVERRHKNGPRGPHGKGGPHGMFDKNKTVLNAHIKGENVTIVCDEQRGFEECLTIFTDAVGKIGKK
mgnify:CR=1 FL=1